MTTTTAPRHLDGRQLAVALGVARATVPAPALPPMTLEPVPGLSPLEASGWAQTGTIPTQRTVPTQRTR